MVTVDDVYTRYRKPSLDGKVIFRKKESRQTSKRLKERQEAMASLESINAEEKALYDKLIKEGKCEEKAIYKPGIGHVKGYACPFIKKEQKDDNKSKS